MRFERSLRVALVHLAYGVIILTTVYVLEPLVGWWRGGTDRDLLMQRALYRAAALFRRLVTALRVIDMSFVGVDRLTDPGPLLAVANHPTHLDGTLLVSVAPQLDHVAEVSWAKNPLTRRAIVGSGHMINDDPRRVIEEGARRLAAKRRLVIFPEGTRSPTADLHPFHRGAARIALAAGCDLVPIVIRCDPPFGKKGQPWYAAPDETPRMSFTVGVPLSPQDALDGTEGSGLAARKVTKMLEDHFRRELRLPDCGGGAAVVPRLTRRTLSPVGKIPPRPAANASLSTGC